MRAGKVNESRVIHPRKFDSSDLNRRVNVSFRTFDMLQIRYICNYRIVCYRQILHNINSTKDSIIYIALFMIDVYKEILKSHDRNHADVVGGRGGYGKPESSGRV